MPRAEIAIISPAIVVGSGTWNAFTVVRARALCCMQRALFVVCGVAYAGCLVTVHLNS